MATFRRDLFIDSGSDKTSEVYFVGDAEELTLASRVGSATTVVVQASNATGFREAIPEADWITIRSTTAVSADTVQDFEPGFRWMRCVRESHASWTHAVVAGRNDGGS